MKERKDVQTTLCNAFALYEKEFGEAFPTIPLALSRTEQELLAMVHTCIARGKTVYDLGFCTLHTDIQY